MSQRGFTLIELVLTIVIGSIIMLGIAGYVQVGMKGYVDASSRQRIQTQAQFVLEKMAREIRHAVPNSFAMTNTADESCLSFVPTLNSGYYFQEPTSNDLLFITGENVPGDTLKASDGIRFVINPTHYDDLISGAVSNHLIDKDLALNGDDGNGNADFYRYSLTTPLPSDSIAHRIYLYQFATKVEYCIVKTGVRSNRLTRNGTVVENIVADESQFDYTNVSLQTGGIVYLKFAFEQNGEVSTYQQDVQVLNVP
ncbi:prepilin-type N-terminal cleavage/methylation domain-containing protein [Vibrio campbellii]|uniref:Prepilin-type N-terminal cleavage/methylation domain-containing protein n=1 Tax=Vibrio campbellii TaxID=680 RepID=A0AAE9MZP8_9VIBR|nr:prepilin-type N-terminal cleavage/methylation domain-containing protein [Vibrio campbellii]UTZ26952.1 prepilin-type N-terminal cleavage/methylation domain-containing protein [Vibrio campbellii]|tara:strand:- start:502 stop:1263 length:762 start_codon:yes stop_codon:yes gene_type:complete